MDNVPGMERVVERLSAEFSGIFSPETIARYVEESAETWLADATVTTFIPVLIERFSRQRLAALAQTEGLAVKTVPEVLFVCVHNAGRSQMAAALLDHLGDGRVRSPGSTPAEQINPEVVKAMDEIGIDVSHVRRGRY